MTGSNTELKTFIFFLPLIYFKSIGTRKDLKVQVHGKLLTCTLLTGNLQREATPHLSIVSTYACADARVDTRSTLGIPDALSVITTGRASGL